ncbi:hypothetical protein ACFE04_031185 [Oxalis oulophora]
MEGFDVVNGGQRRRVTLRERMLAVEDRNSRDSSSTLAGLLTLDALLTGSKSVAVAPPSMAAEDSTPTSSGNGRTLLDVIRDGEPHKGQKDKKSWKTFRDRLRLKRAGAAWTSSLHTPTSDIIQPQTRYPRGGLQVRFVTPESARENSAGEDNGEVDNSPAVDTPAPAQQRPVFGRRTSTRIAYSVDSGSHDSDMIAGDAPPASRRLATALAEERTLSAREAAASQEAAEAEAAAAAESSDEEEEEGGAGEPVRMSLMDLLEETDRQMGLSGSRYTMGEDVYYEEEEEEEEVVVAVAVEEDDGSGGGVEHTCCVCMVRHKGAAFIPCGHTFCRLCSRELLVQRGQCPICNGFILEILDIF